MNMDDYFKQSFDPSNFEFKEEYWQGAKKLLDKDTSRRLIINRIAIAAALFMFMSLSAVLYMHTYNAEPSVIADEILLEKEPMAKINHEKASISNLSGTNAYSSANTNSGEEPTSDVSQKVETTVDERIMDQTVSTNPLVINDETPDYTAKPPHNKRKSTTSNNKTPSHVALLPDLDLPVTEISSSAKDYLAVVPVSHYQIELLPTNRRNKIKSQTNQFGFFTTQPFAFGSFSSGSFTAGVRSNYTTFIGSDFLAFPNFSRSGVRYMGYGASVNQQIPIKNNLFFETGIGLNIQMGDFSPSIRSVHLSFDFGPRENSIVLNPNELYSIQIPLFIGFSMKAHQLSGGILTSALTAVRGTHEYRSGILPWEPPSGNNYSQIQNGWLATDGFRNFLVSYGMRYNVQVSRFLQLSLSAQYRPFDWIDEDFGSYFDLESMSYVRPASEITNPLRRNVIIGVGMRYSYSWKR
jgi:hypothetical protein